MGSSELLPILIWLTVALVLFWVTSAIAFFRIISIERKLEGHLLVADGACHTCGSTQNGNHDQHHEDSPGQVLGLKEILEPR